MDTASLMSGPPPLPGERELPDSLARRRELLAMIAADRRAQRVPRWAVALAAAAARRPGVAVAAGSLLPALRSPPPASTGPDQPGWHQRPRRSSRLHGPARGAMPSDREPYRDRYAAGPDNS